MPFFRDSEFFSDKNPYLLVIEVIMLKKIEFLLSFYRLVAFPKTTILITLSTDESLDKKGDSYMSILILTSLMPHLISQFGSLVYVGLFALIFIETGVVVLPFLPGDSILFLCGSLAALSTHSLNIGVLILTLGIAAILGDSLNFEIGKHFGEQLFHHKLLSKLIKPKYLARSEKFYQTHGKSAIFLGRFIPIIRTFTPFTAGMSNMHHRDFIIYNVLGAMSWVLITLGSGFLLGNNVIVKAHFELIMLGVVGISLIPAVISLLRHRGGVANAS